MTTDSEARVLEKRRTRKQVWVRPVNAANKPTQTEDQWVFYPSTRAACDALRISEHSPGAYRSIRHVLAEGGEKAQVVFQGYEFLLSVPTKTVP